RAARQVHHVIQADGELTVVAKPPVRAAVLVWMLPRVAHNLCIGKRCSLFDETGSLSPNLKIVVPNSPKAATMLNKHDLGEKKEDRHQLAAARAPKRPCGPVRRANQEAHHCSALAHWEASQAACSASKSCW